MTLYRKEFTFETFDNPEYRFNVRGTVAPDGNIGGEGIELFATFGENWLVLQMLGSTQIPGYLDAIPTSIHGLGNFTLPWHVGNTRYEGSIPGVREVFQQAMDGTVGFGIAFPDSVGGGGGVATQEEDRRLRRQGIST